MALSLGDINKKNPARKPKKSSKARGKTLMPWQIPGSQENHTQTTHKEASDSNHTQTTHKLSEPITESVEKNNYTQTTHNNPDTKTQNHTQTAHKLHTDSPRPQSSNSTQTKHKPNTNDTQINEPNPPNSTRTQNQTQTTHKQHTTTQDKLLNNHTQTTHTPEPQADTPPKPLETAHKLQTPLHTKGTQLPTNRTQTDHKQNTNYTPHHTQKLHTEIARNYTQIEPENLSELEQKLRKLSGLKLKLFDYIYAQCIENLSNELVITYEALSHFSGVKTTSIKEITRRLDNKDHLIQRVSPRGGRGTTTIFSIPSEILNVYTRIRQTTHSFPKKLHTNNDVTTHKPHTPPHTNVPSKEVEKKSPSYLEPETAHSFEFLEIDLTSVRSLGITEKQLQDIQNQRLSLTTHQVQTLVDKYSEYAQQPDVKIRRHSGLFIHFAQKLAHGEDLLSEVETPEEKLLRQQLESRLEQRKRRESRLKELFDSEFAHWKASMNKEELLNLVPEKKFALYESPAWTADLRNHFDREVWPDIKKDLFS